MVNQNTGKKDCQDSQTAAVKKKDVLIISSKLLADWKYRGITAFKQMTDDDRRQVWQWSKAVLRQYLSKLETDPSNIRNVKSLPFPKEDIKLAIKLALLIYISKDMQRMVKKLKAAYKEIGTFQPIDVQDNTKSFCKKTARCAASLQNNKTICPQSEQYTEISVSEKKALLQEINDFVTDLEALT